MADFLEPNFSAVSSSRWGIMFVSNAFFKYLALPLVDINLFQVNMLSGFFHQMKKKMVCNANRTKILHHDSQKDHIFHTKKKQPEKIPLTIFFRYEEASKENIINQEHNISPFLGDVKFVSNIFHIPITLSERF